MESMSIAAIRSDLNERSLDAYSAFIKKYEADERQGVIALVKKAQLAIHKYEKELMRLEQLGRYEEKYRHKGYIAGIDEVGRGPLAGPVVTAAVILPTDIKILNINDSKKCSESLRERLYDEIMEKAIAVSFGIVDVADIDTINISQATFKAMRQSIHGLKILPQVLLVDAVTIPNISIEQIGIVKGDSKSISIAAASIVAKVTRDRMMVQYDELFPGYGFAANKGYGSAEHIEALKQLGPTPIHRRSFIKNFV